MSKKYQDLTEQYSGDIEKIRSLKAAVQAALDKVNAHDKANIDWSDDLAVSDHQEDGQDLYRQWQELSDVLNIECEKLTQDIEAEYSEVPFAKSRRQGIEKFWELVGI